MIQEVHEPHEDNILQKAVSSFVLHRKFHLCIHDTSGILYSNPLLTIPVNHRNHTGCFCRNAKTTAAGLRFCLRCKAASLRKAMAGKETYIGQCYLGMVEIVRPVMVDGKMVCVIYLGNLFREDKKDEMLERIAKICRITGADSKTLADSLRSSQAFYETDIEAYYNMLDVLEYIIKAFAGRNPGHKKSGGNSPIYCPTNHWAIEAIQNYIFEFHNRDLKLSQLAKLFFLNPDYLCRLFRKETGMSFSEYVNDIRISQAKSLLELTNDGIMDISLQIGFNNVTYFNYLFKKATGISPKQYRVFSRSKSEQRSVPAIETEGRIK